jgi:hypothetical protein
VTTKMVHLVSRWVMLFSRQIRSNRPPPARHRGHERRAHRAGGGTNQAGGSGRLTREALQPDTGRSTYAPTAGTPPWPLVAKDEHGASPISNLVDEIGRAAQAGWAQTARMTVLLAVAAAAVVLALMTSR